MVIWVSQQWWYCRRYTLVKATLAFDTEASRRLCSSFLNHHHMPGSQREQTLFKIFQQKIINLERAKGFPFIRLISKTCPCIARCIAGGKNKMQGNFWTAILNVFNLQVQERQGCLTKDLGNGQWATDRVTLPACQDSMTGETPGFLPKPELIIHM